MNWKEFFYPTKKKIILFILFLLINTFLPLTLMEYKFYYSRFELKSYQEIFHSFHYYIKLPLNWIILIIDLILLYSISCLIISFYDKLKIEQKAKLKEFFKPAKKKIILFVVFLLINIFIPLVPSIVYYVCEWPPCPLYPALIFESYQDLVNHHSWGLLIIDIIFWYLISCIITFAYNKFKVKKK